MVRYKISGNVNIIDPVDYTYADTPREYREKHYILCDRLRDKDFLITETVKYFIDKFSFPRTETEVLEEIASEVKSSIHQIEKKCSSFFNFLRKRKLLVPENYVELKPLIEPLYKAGDRINDLNIVEILANKHYVDVYLIRDETDQCNYVIKLLNRNKIKSKSKYLEELADLEREYEMLKNVNHLPFVSHAYEFNKIDNESPYIRLEYVKGKSLSRFLRQEENLTESDCILIISNILQAFSSLHENKLIHGDIHSSNIMVSEDKSVKIIDLGLSLHTNTDENEVVRIGGVDHYMPPERIDVAARRQFSNEPDLYSDVYQIGVILYLVLYKKEPFTAFTWRELAKSIKEGNIQYPGLSFLNDAVSPEMIRIIKKCLDKVPGKRYKSATDLFEDFKKTFLQKKELDLNRTISKPQQCVPSLNNN